MALALTRAWLFRLGAKDSLAKITVLGLGEFSLNPGKLLARLGHLVIVTLLHPLHALHGPLAHRL